ncbi:MAG: hypothetical protein V4850_34275 [Myxococcota bacterium]
MGKGQVKSTPAKAPTKGAGPSSNGASGAPKARDNSVMKDALAQKAPALDEGATSLMDDFDRYQGDYGVAFGQAFALSMRSHAAQDSGDIPGYHAAVGTMLDVNTAILYRLDWFLPGMGINQQFADLVEDNPDVLQVEEFRAKFLRAAAFAGVVKQQRALLVPFLVPRSVHGKVVPTIPGITLGNLSYTEAVEAQVGSVEPIFTAATELRTLLASGPDAKGGAASGIATDAVAGPMSDYEPGSGEFEYLYEVVKHSRASSEVKARVDWLLGRDDVGAYEQIFGTSLMLNEIISVAWQVGSGSADVPAAAAPAAVPTADQHAATRAAGKTAGVQDFDSSKAPKEGGKGEEYTGPYASERGMARVQTSREAEGKLTAGDGKVGAEAGVKQKTERRSGESKELGGEASLEAGATLSGSGKVSGQRTGADGTTRGGSVSGGRDAEGNWNGGADASKTTTNADGSKTTTTGGVTVSQSGKVGATGGRSVEDAAGNKRGTSGSGSYDHASGEVAASVKHSNTDKDGNDKGSIGGGGAIDLDGKDGKTGAKADLSVSKGSKSFSMSGGYTITVAEPKQEGKRWVVTYETELSGKVGGGVKNKKAGASGSIGGSDKKTGRRSFGTEAEAKAFWAKPSLDGLPADAKAAAGMAEGDQRGSEGTFDVGGDVNAKLGAVEIGAGASHSSTNFENQTKGQGGKIRVEVGRKEIDEVHGSVGMAGVSGGMGKSWASHESVTVEFDLDTAEGRNAYNHHQRYHALPRGARGWKMVGSAKGNAETDSYSLGLLGVKLGSSHTVSHGVEYDEGNKYERDAGTDSSSVSVPLIGNYERSHKLSMLEVNDGRSFFNTESTVKGSSLKDVRSGLARSAMETEQGVGGSNKGTYKLQTAIPEGDMDRFIQVATSPTASEMFNEKGGLHATDGLKDLRNGLLKAKGDKDTQRRVLARWVADEGYDALTVLHALTRGKFDARGEGGTQMFVAIEGDPYMDGMKGQLDLELRIQRFDQRLGNGERGAALASEIRKDINFQRAKARHLEECPELPYRVYAQEYDRIRSNTAILDSVLQRSLTQDGAATGPTPGGDLESPRFVAFRRACANLSVARSSCERSYEWAYKEYRINETGAYQSKNKRRAEYFPKERGNFDNALALYRKGDAARSAALLAESLSSQRLDERSVGPLTAIVTKSRAEYMRAERFFKEATDVYFEISTRNIGKGPYVNNGGERMTPGQ